jgi:hypothetical protein
MGFVQFVSKALYLHVREWLRIPLTVVLCEDLDGRKTEFFCAVYRCGYTTGNGCMCTYQVFHFYTVKNSDQRSELLLKKKPDYAATDEWEYLKYGQRTFRLWRRERLSHRHAGVKRLLRAILFKKCAEIESNEHVKSSTYVCQILLSHPFCTVRCFGGYSRFLAFS